MTPLLLLSLLLAGTAPEVGGFSICGWRNQSKGGNLMRYRFIPGDSTVRIENSAEALDVFAPFPPSHDITQLGLFPPSHDITQRGSSAPFPPTCDITQPELACNITLQTLPGPYTFCVRWIPALQLFNFTYGITVSHAIYVNPASEEQVSTKPHPQQTCNHTFHLVNVTINGQLEPGSCRYELATHPSRYDADTLEDEISVLSDHLAKGSFSGDGRWLRGWMDEALSAVDFHGNSHYFGGGALQAAVYKLTSSNVITSVSDHLGVSLTLPNKLLERTPDGAAKRLHVVRIQGHALFQAPANSSILDGLVLGITLQETEVSNLPEDIVITFPHKPLQGTVSPLCVFWDELSEEWSAAGCRTVPAERQTQCRCNHLTYFAVLMQTSSQVISENHLVWLTTLTFAGCAISALACIFTIAWMCGSRKSQANPTLQIHMHLLGALLLLDVSFVASALLGALEDVMLCCGAAMVLHFALLSLFSWMAIEGFNLYRLVVKVFLSSAITTGKLAIVAWGAPLLIILIIFFLRAENYGIYYMRVERPSSHNSTASMCWLTDPFIHQLVNLGLFAAVLIFNMCMLGAMTMRVLRLSAHSRREKVRHCITLLGLSCMLGLSWGLAFFSFGAFYLPVQYAFSTINALQGLFILLWYWALSQPHAKDSMRSSDCSSATPASPRADQTLSTTDHKKLLS